MKFIRLIKKIILTVIFTACFIAVIFYVWICVTKVTVAELPAVKNGDLVFQTIKSSQSLAIAFASASFYTHVGMIKIASDGTALVLEAVGPVREKPLKNWITQGIFGRITLERIESLDKNSANEAVKGAMKYYGLPYDFFFSLDNERIYCSELVYKAFKEGAGIKLGTLQKVGTLNVHNFIVDKLIHERWHQDPLCKNLDYTACYSAIMEKELITPASMANDPKLKVIYSNYGIFR